MAWKKSSESLTATFDAALPADPRVQRRQMFGYPAAFVNGNLFAGLHEERMIVRLDEAGRRELLGVEGASIFEPMRGRPMREYVVVPPSILGDKTRLRGWMARALTYGAMLPAKTARVTRGQPRLRIGRKGLVRSPFAGDSTSAASSWWLTTRG